jgi:uncharacterized RDD family membrane protein YckC
MTRNDNIYGICTGCTNRIYDTNGRISCAVNQMEIYHVDKCENFKEIKLADQEKDYLNLDIANVWKRLANALIDQICMYVLVIIIAFVVVIYAILTNSDLSWLERDSDLSGLIIGIITTFTYYVFFESIFSASIGKFITGTRVVNKDGSKPSFKSILGRTLSRCIPLEFLSFFKNNPIGIHDSLSETLVIDIRKKAKRDNGQDKMFFE